MSKKFFGLKTLLAFGATICLAVAIGVSVGSQKEYIAQAEETTSEMSTEVKRIENWEDGQTLMVHFTESDYMTAPWDTNSNAAYHWYLSDYLSGDELTKFYSLNGQLAYEDKGTYNMPNALLTKNLDAYNYGEYITINGKSLSEYGSHSLMANKATRVHSLGIQVGATVLNAASEIVFKAGCTIPTLEYSYFGVGEYSALVLQEDFYFRLVNGAWARHYPFEGYEDGVEYDGAVEYLYTRQSTESFYGYPEAYTSSIRDTLANLGLGGDEGTSLISDVNTQKGNLMIIDFVNPIDTTEFGAIKLKMYCNYARTLATYNAYTVTAESKGEVLETFTHGGGTKELMLLSSLYADENGMVDRLVFEFTNDRYVDPEKPETIDHNQMFLTAFSVGKYSLTTSVYDGSLLMLEDEDNYNWSFRFNKRGEFNDATLDTDKVLINGASLTEINSQEENIQAKWVSVQGIYQINFTIPKAYEGLGAIVNADLNFYGNKIEVLEGLPFPNGEDVLERTYTYHLFGKESFVDGDLISDYKETKLASIDWMIDPTATDNITLFLSFDKKIAAQVYYHACETEAWRETALYDAGLYDKELSKAFIAGGFKSALYDCLYINGKSIGEIHARDEWATCVLMQYGQAGAHVISVSVDSRSATYAELLPLFESGEDVTIEVKAGMTFTTGVRTETSFCFVLKNGEFILQTADAEATVFFNGVKVEQGAAFISEVKVLQSSIYVEGASSYTVTETREGSLVTFVVAFENGESVTFTVEEQITNEVPQDSADSSSGLTSCLSSVSTVWGGVALIASAVTVLMRKKKDEENNQ